MAATDTAPTMMIRRDPVMRYVVVALSVFAATMGALVTPTVPLAVAADQSCPDLPVTVGELSDLYPSGPLAQRYPPGVPSFSQRALACFGSRTLAFRAFVPPYPGLGVGGPQTYGIEPRWMGGALMVTPSEQQASPLRFLVIAVPPAFGDLEARYGGRRVRIDGHYDDPTAQTCTGGGAAGETPTRAEAIEICRSTFVLSRISTSMSPPATDTARAPANDASAVVYLFVAALLGLLSSWAVTRRGDQRRRGGP